jgi:hypothetical protein
MGLQGIQPEEHPNHTISTYRNDILYKEIVGLKRSSKDYDITLTITRLAEEIVSFDTNVLRKIHEVMPEDFAVYRKIVLARESLFDLEEQMHGCEIVEFAGAAGNPGGEI